MTMSDKKHSYNSFTLRFFFFSGFSFLLFTPTNLGFSRSNPYKRGVVSLEIKTVDFKSVKLALVDAYLSKPGNIKVCRVDWNKLLGKRSLVLLSYRSSLVGETFNHFFRLPDPELELPAAFWFATFLSYSATTSFS